MTRVSPSFLGRLVRQPLVVAIIGGALLLHLGVYAATGYGVPCAFHTVTGLPCFGCGLSRALLNLAAGNGSAMWALHPFAPYFAVLGATVGLTLVLSPARREAWASWLDRLEGRTRINRLILSLFVVYGLSRLLAGLWKRLFLLSEGSRIMQCCPATGLPIIMLIIMVPAVAVGIVSLVCWIMTLIPIFKENVGLGILGIICGLFAFIYGWVKVKEYNNKKVMIVWSIAMVAGLLLQVVSMVASVVLAQAGSAG